MWFKTRIGLCSVIEPFEVRIGKYPKEKLPYYLIFARSLNDSDVRYKGIFGNLTAPGRYAHLARFEMSEAAEPKIAQCMMLIEEAIASESRICDLSAAGDADAWASATNDWFLVRW